MVTHQLQVRCRPVKVRRSETDVLPLSHPLPTQLSSVEVVNQKELTILKNTKKTKSKKRCVSEQQPDAMDIKVDGGRNAWNRRVLV